MKAVVTAKEMKMIDTFTIQNLGIPSLVLMERAALSMADHMTACLPPQTRILCICGAGNNGGDGVALARIMYCRGYDSAIFMAGDPEKWTEETKKQIQIARNTGVPEYNRLDMDAFDVLVDGIFGIGLTSRVRPPFDEWIEKMNAWRSGKKNRQIWAVDIASGLSSDTGQVLGCAVKADVTVTFGYKKRGMILYPGRDYSGRCYVEDIGFPQKALDMNPTEGFTYDVQNFEQLPERKNDSNKGSYGKILVIAGSRNMSGAAYFSAYAAYASGAGLVKILTCEANRIILQCQLPQAMLSVWEDMTEDGYKELTEWADAVVIGPGIGTDPDMAKRIEAILPIIKCPLILDADGLNLLSSHKEWYKKLPESVIITPHMGEMSRLTGIPIDVLKADRAQKAKDFACEHNLICVLKDSSTVVSDGKKVYFNQTGNHGMATGGSGDVLTGIIAAIASVGKDTFHAACAGVFLHGMGGDWAAGAQSSRGMTCVDIIHGICQVMKKMEN